MSASQDTTALARLAKMRRECELALDPAGPMLEYADGDAFYADVLWALAALDERTRERDTWNRISLDTARELAQALIDKGTAEAALENARQALRIAHKLLGAEGYFQDPDYPEAQIVHKTYCDLSASVGLTETSEGTPRREVLGDQDLWSLLNGYGPDRYSRPQRNATAAERWEIIASALRKATDGVTAGSNVRLVLEIAPLRGAGGDS